MSAPTKPLYDWTPDEMLAFSDRGEAIYEERLKAILEPERSGEYVAIDPDSGEYAVGADLTAATQMLRRRRPDGLFYTLKIGPDLGSPMAERMTAGGAAVRRKK